MNHYTYWLEDTNNRAYIGVRSYDGNVYDDSYMSSSECVREAVKNGMTLKKTILSTWPSREDALIHEILLHEIFDVANNPKFYNKARQTSTKFNCSTKGRKHAPETIELFRKQKSGTNHPNFGKKGVGTTAYGHRHSAEQKEKMRNPGSKNGMYGKKHSEKSIDLMKENRPDTAGENNPFFGKKHKEESKQFGERNHMYNKTRSKHQNAKKINTPFGIFDCMKDAADSLKVSNETIRNRVKSASEQFSEYFVIVKESEHKENGSSMFAISEI